MNHSVSRVIASVLAVLLMASLVFAPAVSADAYSTDSLEVALNIDGTDVSIKFCGSEDLLAILASMGEQDSAMNLNLYAGQVGLILELLPLLPEAYGIDAANLAGKLPGSVFAPDSGSAFALPQDVFEMLMSAADFGGEQAQQTSALDPEVLMAAAAALAGHFEAASEVISKNSAMSVSPAVLHLDYGDVNVSQVTVSVGPEAIGGAVKAMLSSMQGDEELKGLLVQVFDMVSGQLPENMAGADGADLLDSVWGSLEQLGDQAAELYVQMNLSVVLDMAMDQETEQPVAMGMTVSMEDNEVSVRATMLGNGALVQVNVNGESIGAQFTLDEMTDTGFTASIRLTQNEQEAAVLQFTLNMEESTFLASASVGAETHSVGGSILSGDDGSVIIRLDTVDGEPAPFSAAIVLRQDDTVEVPAYRDVLTMTEDEVSQLMQMGIELAQAFGLMEPAA